MEFPVEYFQTEVLMADKQKLPGQELKNHYEIALLFKELVQLSDNEQGLLDSSKFAYCQPLELGEKTSMF